MSNSSLKNPRLDSTQLELVVELDSPEDDEMLDNSVDPSKDETLDSLASVNSSSDLKAASAAAVSDSSKNIIDKQSGAVDDDDDEDAVVDGDGDGDEEEDEEERVDAAAAGDEDYVESEAEDVAMDEDYQDDDDSDDGVAGNKAKLAAGSSEAQSDSAGAESEQKRRPARNATKSVDYRALQNGLANVKHTVRQRKQPYNEEGVRVYCICRKPDNGKFMIQCDSCKDWYHGACVEITERAARDIKSYECDECEEVRKQNEVSAALFKQKMIEAAQNERLEEGQNPRKARPPAVKIEKKDGSNSPATKSGSPSPATFWSKGKQVTLPGSKRNSVSSASKVPQRKGSVSSLPSTPGADASTPLPGESDVGPNSTMWMRDKVRSAVRKAFTDTFTAILADPELQEALSEPDVTKMDPALFSAEVEDELFDFLSDGIRGYRRSCGDKYKGKFRTLQFNLKDVKNKSLRKRIATSAITASVLVRLEAEDLANEEIKAKAEAVRLESIRNSLKPKEVAAIFKKTHKGEEEISSGDPSLSSSKDAPSAVYAAPATGAMARIIERSVRSPSPTTGEKPFHSLDELLAKMGNAPRKPVAEENGGSFGVEKPDETMFDRDADNAMDTSYDPTVVRPDADFSTWEDAAIGFGDEEDIGQTYSPSRSPLNDDYPMESGSADSNVWSGIIRMANVGMFNGVARQIAGREVGTAKTWENVLPATLTIEGRIDTRRAKDYVAQQRNSPSKEIIAVVFDVHTEGDSEKAQEGFKTLFDYFYEKNRYAVVGQNYISVKDMYLVPVRADEPLPEMITVLRGCSIGVERRDHDSIFGVVVMDKGFFSKSPSSQIDLKKTTNKRPAKSSHEPRKRHASQDKPVPTSAPIVPPIPQVPTLPFGQSTPYVPPAVTAAPAASILASLAALSNLQQTNLYQPQNTVSALLAQLQQPQQPPQPQPPYMGPAQVNNIQNILASLQNSKLSTFSSSGLYGQR
ncbi:PHD finger protein 3 [Phlyctochytrium planicorne]|nr:PHD finger protein 3 [Phlyctochytrium planicorne]